MFNPDEPAIHPGISRPIVTGPAPHRDRTHQGPPNAHDRMHPTPHGSQPHRHKPHPVRATDSPQAAARASLPIPTMSISNQRARSTATAPSGRLNATSSPGPGSPRDRQDPTGQA